MHRAKKTFILASFILLLLAEEDETLGACSWRAQFIRRGKMCVVPGLLLGDDTFVTYRVALWMWQKNNWVVGACLELNSLMSRERERAGEMKRRKTRERQKRRTLDVDRLCDSFFLIHWDDDELQIHAAVSFAAAVASARWTHRDIQSASASRNAVDITNWFAVTFAFYSSSLCLSLKERKEKTGNKYCFNFYFMDP